LRRSLGGHMDGRTTLADARLVSSPGEVASSK
jgi:hypothetical protein